MKIYNIPPEIELDWNLITLKTAASLFKTGCNAKKLGSHIFCSMLGYVNLTKVNFNQPHFVYQSQKTRNKNSLNKYHPYPEVGIELTIVKFTFTQPQKYIAIIII